MTELEPTFVDEDARVACTIFGDGSYDPVHRAAGWAGWFRASHMEKGRFVSGSATIEKAGSTQAELLALAETLRLAARDGAVLPHTNVMLQSDNVHGLAILLTSTPRAIVSQGEQDSLPVEPAKRIGPAMRGSRPVRVIVELADRLDLKLLLRHCRAHVGRETDRTWVHSQCDVEAKRQMRAHRQQLLAQPERAPE